MSSSAAPRRGARGGRPARAVGRAQALEEHLRQVVVGRPVHRRDDGAQRRRLDLGDVHRRRGRRPGLDVPGHGDARELQRAREAACGARGRSALEALGVPAAVDGEAGEQPAELAVVAEVAVGAADAMVEGAVVPEHATLDRRDAGGLHGRGELGDPGRAERRVTATRRGTADRRRRRWPARPRRPRGCAILPSGPSRMSVAALTKSFSTEAGTRWLSARRSKIVLPLSRSRTTAPADGPAARISRVSLAWTADSDAAVAGPAVRSAAARTTATRRRRRTENTRSRTPHPPDGCGQRRYAICWCAVAPASVARTG